MDMGVKNPGESAQPEALLLPAENQGVRPAGDGIGCGGGILLAVAALGVLLISLIHQQIYYLVEQSVFLGDLSIPDVRWLLSLVYAVLLLVTCLIILAAVKNRLLKSIFRTWVLAAAFALIVFPGRFFFVTNSLAAALVQAAGLSVLIIGLLIWRGRRAAPGRQPALPLSILAGLAICVPWVMWGALGSPFDTIINLLVALLFGTACGILFETSLLDGVDRSGVVRWGSVQLLSLAAAVAVLIMVIGMGQNGNMGILAISIPMAAWAAVSFQLSGRGLGKKRWPASGWPTAAVLLALTAAGPLVFVDPDELSLAFSGGAGETIEWANRMMGAAFLIGLFLAVVSPFLARLTGSLHKGWRLTWLLAPVGLALLGFIYVQSGRVGFYGERLFVILRDQADVSAAAGMSDYTARKEFVYRTLVDQANESQAGLIASLDRFGVAHRSYYLVNGLVVDGGPFLRLWLESRPEVDRVIDNPQLRPLPGSLSPESGFEQAPAGVEWNLAMIGADKVWDMGITGRGVVIGQSDTGVQGDHPELADSYRGLNGGDDYNWYDPYFHTTHPSDIGGHGTHTLGIVVGNTVGVAPDAAWIACSNMGRNLGAAGYYLDCWQFLFAPFPQDGDPLQDGDPARGAHIFNNSWGCPDTEGCDPGALTPAADALRAAGIFVVVSAGNSGSSQCGTVIDPPAIYDPVYSVGAVDSSGSLAPFSSVGPVSVDGSQRIKPDIAAPGVDVLSAFPNNTYSILSGTSMAGPHTAGVVALMWSANPDLIGNIERTEEILNETAGASEQVGAPACALPGQRPNNAFGYGILDAYAAVIAAMSP